MRRIACALLLVFAGCSRGGLAPASSEGLWLRGAHLVDPARGEVREGSLVVRRGRIVEVLAAGVRPASFQGREIDLSGKWLLPAFTDLHVHSWGNPSPTDRGDEELGTAGVLKLVPLAGVARVLDLGGPEDERLQARRPVVPGSAELLAAGPVWIEKRGGSTKGRAIGKGPRFVSGPRDARAQLAEFARKSPDVVKIIYDHAGSRSSMRRSTLRALASEAKALGLKTVVHIGTWADARDAIEAGVTAVTHLYDDEPIPRDLPKLWARRGVYSIPTMAVQCDFARATADPAFARDPLLERLTTPALRAELSDRARFSERAQFWQEWQAEDCVKHDVPSLAALAKAGVRILTGTDAGNLGVFEGYSVHRELYWLEQAGLSAWEALRATTTRAGEFLGRNFGLDTGAEASFVILDKSPLEHIENTEKISLVVLRGEILTQSVKNNITPQ